MDSVDKKIEETIKLQCLSTKLMFIFTSQATCNALGAYLTEIQTQDEQEFIEDIKKKSMVCPYFYFFVHSFTRHKQKMAHFGPGPGAGPVG